MPAARGHRDHGVGTIAEAVPQVDLERDRYRDHVLGRTHVKRRVATRRTGVGHQLLEVGVRHVETGGRLAPGHVLVLAQHDPRSARNAAADGIEAALAGVQVNLVEIGRQVEAQVRVVRDQRPAVLGPPSRNGPFVTADLLLGSGQCVFEERHALVTLAQALQPLRDAGIQTMGFRRGDGRGPDCPGRRAALVLPSEPRNGARPVASGIVDALSNGAERNTSPKNMACAACGPSFDS